MIEYLNNEVVKKIIDNGITYQKSALTGLRKPKSEEISIEFPTYVLKDGELRIESYNVVSEDKIFARNPGVLLVKDGKEIYNEWLIGKEVAIKNYGIETVNALTDNFEYYKKKSTIKAVELSKEIMEILEVSGDSLDIKVSWSDKPMVAKIGDYITDEGYSISKNDMEKTYEMVSKNKSALKNK